MSLQAWVVARLDGSGRPVFVHARDAESARAYGADMMGLKEWEVTATPYGGPTLGELQRD